MPRRAAAADACRRSQHRSGPRRAAIGSRPSRISSSASGGRRVSACRNSRTSPLAIAAPAFIWVARPRALAMTTIGERLRERDGLVRAAAIDHDHFGAARAQRRKRVQRRDDTCGFVENRNDDGERRRSRHSAASFSAPPQLEPWPAVQPKQWPATRIGLSAMSSSSRSERCTRSASPRVSGRSSIWLKSQS